MKNMQINRIAHAIICCKGNPVQKYLKQTWAFKNSLTQQLDTTFHTYLANNPILCFSEIDGGFYWSLLSYFLMNTVTLL